MKKRKKDRPVRSCRAPHPAPPEAQSRIPAPHYLYYGKEIWESAAAALLCGAAFAAYTNGWFGFDRLFGEKTALIEGHIASYDETTDVDITQPTYTEEEQAMIDEGTMQVPDIADLSDTGVSAETDDFTFTLESMLVSRNSLYAILRIDAKNDDAAAELAAIPETDGYQKELKRMLWVGAHNNTNFGGFGADHRLEWKNGGMSMEIMQVEGSTAYALLTNIGGAHQENFFSLQEKCMEKLSLFKNCDVVIYNGDDEFISNCVAKSMLSAREIAWSRKDMERPLFISKVEKKEDCTAKNIKAVKINFRPSTTIRPDVTATRAGQKIDFYDLEALVNKDGSSSGGNSSGDQGGSGSGEGGLDENPLG